jgi:hypothetical protein
MVNAERSFRRIKSCKDMPVLVAALACHTKEVSVQRDLGDRQADQSGVADVGRAAGSTRGPQQIVHKALQCDDEVVETGVHEASLESTSLEQRQVSAASSHLLRLDTLSAYGRSSSRPRAGRVRPMTLRG